MPTYEYACRACGEHLEVVQSFSDDPLTVCEGCGGELRKVFSAAGLIFKGSGWHIKDYSSSGAKPSTSTRSSDGGSGSGSDGGSGDAGGSATTKDSAASSSTSSGTSSSSSSSSD